MNDLISTPGVFPGSGRPGPGSLATGHRIGWWARVGRIVTVSVVTLVATAVLLWATATTLEWIREAFIWLSECTRDFVDELHRTSRSLGR